MNSDFRRCKLMRERSVMIHSALLIIRRTNTGLSVSICNSYTSVVSGILPLPKKLHVFPTFVVTMTYVCFFRFLFFDIYSLRSNIYIRKKKNPEYICLNPLNHVVFISFECPDFNLAHCKFNLCYTLRNFITGR